MTESTGMGFYPNNFVPDKLFTGRRIMKRVRELCLRYCSYYCSPAKLRLGTTGIVSIKTCLKFAWWFCHSRRKLFSSDLFCSVEERIKVWNNMRMSLLSIASKRPYFYWPYKPWWRQRQNAARRGLSTRFCSKTLNSVRCSAAFDLISSDISVIGWAEISLKLPQQ